MPLIQGLYDRIQERVNGVKQQIAGQIPVVGKQGWEEAFQDQLSGNAAAI